MQLSVMDLYFDGNSELLEDYFKAVDSLTINKISNNEILEKEMEVLREKNENNEYTIRAKLQEKDDAYIALSDRDATNGRGTTAKDEQEKLRSWSNFNSIIHFC
jgi:hypothetical protein